MPASSPGLRPLFGGPSSITLHSGIQTGACVGVVKRMCVAGAAAALGVCRYSVRRVAPTGSEPRLDRARLIEPAIESVAVEPLAAEGLVRTAVAGYEGVVAGLAAE